MSRAILLILLFSPQFCVIAQFHRGHLDLSWYDTDQGQDVSLNSNHITSDFGRRDCPPCTNKWHDGLDISGSNDDPDDDIGYKIRSISSGRIRHIVHGTYKAITVEGDGNNENFGYGHIFRTSVNAVPGFIFHHWESKDIYIIVCLDEGYALTDANLVSGDHEDVNGVTYSFDDGTLRNTVNAGDIIAPIGDSNTGGAHIHLYNFVSLGLGTFRENRRWSNLKDPTRLLWHLSPDYTVTIEQVKEDDEFTSNPSIRARTFMLGTSGGNAIYNAGGPIKDFNSMKIFVKRRFEHSSDYRLIKGAYFESKIDHGGANNFVARYPSHNNPNGNTSGGQPNPNPGATNLDWEQNPGVDLAHFRNAAPYNAGFGDYRKTGIVGYAYGGDPNIPWVEAEYDEDVTPGPWDDFFFNDFPTRIHRNDHFGRENVQMAQYNDHDGNEGRYPDGKYDVYAEGENVFGDRFGDVDNPTEIIIDNFRPYIKEVSVWRGYILLYRGGWEWDGTGLVFSENRRFPTSVEDDLWIEVVTSEPMKLDEMKLQVNGVSGFVDPIDFSGDHTYFYFQVTGFDSDVLGQLVLRGEDVNGNGLQRNPAVIPIKQSDGTWSPAPDQGDDYNYVINLGEFDCTQEGQVIEGQQSLATAAAGEACLLNSFAVNNQYPKEGGSVVFRPNVILDEYEYSWSFGADAWPSTSNLPEVTVIYNEAGQFDATLTVSSEGVTSAPATKTIWVGETFPSLEVDFDSDIPNVRVGETMSFVADYISEFTNYYWDFGQNAEIISQSGREATVRYLREGYKTVVLNVEDAGQSATLVRENYVAVNDYLTKIESDFLITDIRDQDFCNAEKSMPRVTFQELVEDGDHIYENGERNDKFYWDFGDGGTSSERDPGEWIYSAPGTYTVSLTACDFSGCDTHTEEIEICEEAIQLPESEQPDIVVNGVPRGNNSFYVPVSAMSPVDINVAAPHEEGGRYEITVLRGWELTIDFFIIDEPGPHKINQLYYVNYEGPYYDPDLIYKVNFIQGQIDTKVYLRPVQMYDNGAIEKAHHVELSNLRFEPVCFGDTRPRLVFDASSYYNGDWNISFAGQSSEGAVSINDWHDNNYELTIDPNNYPYSLSIDQAYYNYYVGEDEHGSVYHSQPLLEAFEPLTFVFESPPHVEVPTEYRLCVGAVEHVGPESNNKYTYKWTPVKDSPIAMSATDIANPLFAAVEEGDYTYNLEITSKDGGCSINRDVTVSVTNEITVDSYDVNARSGTILVGTEPITLDAPVIDGAGIYDFEWSPSTYLDNPRIASPTFTPPRFGATIQYSVNVSYRSCVEATATVDLVVKNPPPSNLTLDQAGPGVIQLSWKDNSIESKFKIDRRVGDGAWSTVNFVGAEVEAFADMDCIEPGVKVCYTVKAYDIKGRYVGKSNVKCVTSQYKYYDVWDIDISDYEANHEDKNEGKQLITYGKIMDENDDNLLFFTTLDGSLNDRTRLAAISIDKETGEVTNTTLGANKYISLQDVEKRERGGYMIAALENNTNLGKVYHYHNGAISAFHGINLAYNDQIAGVSYLNYMDKGGNEVVEVLSGDPWSLTKRYYTFSNSGALTSNIESVMNQIGGVIPTDINEYPDWFESVPAKWGNNTNHLYVIWFSKINTPRTWQAIGMPFDVGRTVNLENVKVQPMYDSYLEKPYESMYFATSVNPSGGEKRYFAARVDNFYQRLYPEVIWEKEFKGVAGSNSEFIKVITDYIDTNENDFVKNHPYLLVGISDSSAGGDKSQGSSGTDIWVINIDRDGKIIWETTIDYNYAEDIFDVIRLSNGDLVFAAFKDKQNGIINIKRVTPYPTLDEEVEVCEVLAVGESSAYQAEQIIVSESCNTEYNSGSSTQLVATQSISFQSGTHIKKGAYFSARWLPDLVDNCDLLFNPGEVPSSRAANHTSSGAEQIQEHLEEDKNLIVYPNPASKSIHFEWGSESSLGGTVLLTDMSGHTALTKEIKDGRNSASLDIEQLANGIYILHLEFMDGLVMRRKVKVLKN